jgi:2-polyprenyl-6-methoxyphenol hydroxylase-like FAD-dependent oxidoreductase
MTLAIELARHGVRSILVERNSSTTIHPKMNYTNGRTMELFRMLGLSERIREVAVPENHSLRVLRVSSLAGHYVHEFLYPAPSERRATARRKNDGTWTLEPAIRISQAVLEPVLREAAEWNPLIDIRFGWRFVSAEDRGDGVVAQIERVADGRAEEVTCRYLAGCDGGGSAVRTQLGIELEGEFGVGRPYLVHFRSRAYDVLNQWGLFWHMQTPGGSLVAQDDTEIWTLNAMISPDLDITPEQVVRDWAGCDFDFEVILANRWSPHLTVANQYRLGNIFIAGDAAHQVVPTGGYGMNSGIGDAVDLGWKLAAVLNGWGGEALLDSYEAERRQIAFQNRAASRRHSQTRQQIASIFTTSGIDDTAPDAPAKWRKFSEKLEEIGNAENESWGIEHGYRYDASPTVAYDGAPREPVDPDRCEPSTLPGARMPDFYLANGDTLFDSLGPDFTLVVAEGAPVAALAGAVETTGVPVRVLEIAPGETPAWINERYILVRPDQHIAWRGNELDGQFASVLRLVSGSDASPVAT